MVNEPGHRAGGDVRQSEEVTRSGTSRGKGGASWRPLLRMGLLALPLVLIPAAVAFAVVAARPALQTARAELLVAVPTNTAVNEENLATQIVLLEGRSVLGPVAKLEGMSAGELTGRVDVERVGDSQVLELLVRDESSERAVGLAEAVLQEYLKVSAVAPGATVEEEFLRTRIQELTTALESLNAQSGPGGSGDRVLRQELLLEQIGSLQGQVTAIEIENLAGDTPVTVVTSPYPLEGETGLTPLRAAAGGLLGGVLLAAVVAVVFARAGGWGTTSE